MLIAIVETAKVQDFDLLIAEGDYPLSDPRASYSLQLLAIVNRLREKGGNKLITEILRPYLRNYLAVQAKILNAQGQFVADG